MASAGEFEAPLQPVTSDEGGSIELRELYGERPLALVFLRHLGCTFCREIVHRLSELPDANLAFVAMESAEQCLAFRRRVESPHRFLSDPTRALYDAFGLGRAAFGQVVSPRTIRRAVGNMASGLWNGVPTADPLMLGGAFVIDVSGRVVWSYRSRDISDNPTAEELLAALRTAESSAKSAHEGSAGALARASMV